MIAQRRRVPEPEILIFPKQDEWVSLAALIVFIAVGLFLIALKVAH